VIFWNEKPILRAWDYIVSEGKKIDIFDYIDPYEQKDEGVEVVQCDTGLILYKHKSTEKPICVKESTKTKLIANHWLKSR